MSLTTPRIRSLVRGGFLTASVLFSVFVLVGPASAQGRMQGRVTDAEGNGIAGVSIVATNPQATPSELSATGNDSGRWQILGISRGNWTFTFRADGYVAHEITATVSGANRNPDLDVELYPVPEGGGAAGAGVGAKQPELFNDGLAMFDAGDYAGAIAKWQEFIGVNPEMYQIQGNIGNAYREMGDTANARVAYEAVIAQEPANTMANYNVGEILVAEGDITGAMPYFESVLEGAPDDPAVYYNVAELYYSQREMETAITYYKRALDVDPTYLPAYMQLGLAYVTSEDNANAILTFEKFLELAPADNPDRQTATDLLAYLKGGV